LLIECVLGLLADGEVSDRTYRAERTATIMLRANLWGKVDEGQDQGFEHLSMADAYFKQVAEFLQFMAETMDRLQSDMMDIERRGEGLSLEMPFEGGRFLVSHVVAQATMLRMLAVLGAGVARAAMVLSSEPEEARRLLQATVEETEKLRKQWGGRYEGRFKDWPADKLLIDIQGKLERIGNVLSSDLLPR